MWPSAAQTSSNCQLGQLEQNFTLTIWKLIPSCWFSKITLAVLKIDFKFSGKCFQAICSGCNFVQCATLQRAQKGRFISLQINKRGILNMINTKLCWMDDAFAELFSSHLVKDVVCRLQTPQVILNSRI